MTVHVKPGVREQRRDEWLILPSIRWKPESGSAPLPEYVTVARLKKQGATLAKRQAHPAPSRQPHRVARIRGPLNLAAAVANN